MLYADMQHRLPHNLLLPWGLVSVEPWHRLFVSQS
jgi:hypothetical protein